MAVIGLFIDRGTTFATGKSRRDRDAVQTTSHEFIASFGRRR